MADTTDPRIRRGVYCLIHKGRLQDGGTIPVRFSALDVKLANDYGLTELAATIRCSRRDILRAIPEILEEWKRG